MSRGGDYVFVRLDGADRLGRRQRARHRRRGAIRGRARHQRHVAVRRPLLCSRPVYGRRPRGRRNDRARADVAGGDGASGEVTPPTPFGATPLSLTLGVVPPSVVETSPAAGATGVPLDSTVVITFSEALDPSSVTEAAVAVRVGTTRSWAHACCRPTGDGSRSGPTRHWRATRPTWRQSPPAYVTPAATRWRRPSSSSSARWTRASRRSPTPAASRRSCPTRTGWCW